MVESCAVCERRTDRVPGRSKRLNNQQDVDFHGHHCGRGFVVGDILCDSCRRRRKPDEESDYDDETFDATIGAPDTPGYESLVDFPALRTAGSHCACVVCNSRESLSVVSLSIRRSVFNKEPVYCTRLS